MADGVVPDRAEETPVFVADADAASDLGKSYLQELRSPYVWVVSVSWWWLWVFFRHPRRGRWPAPWLR